jgi:hypothetical protein
METKKGEEMRKQEWAEREVGRFIGIEPPNDWQSMSTVPHNTDVLFQYNGSNICIGAVFDKGTYCISNYASKEVDEQNPDIDSPYDTLTDEVDFIEGSAYLPEGTYVLAVDLYGDQSYQTFKGEFECWKPLL